MLGDVGTAPNRIRATRQQRGMSLRELASTSGLSPALVSQVERGLTEPSLSTLRKLAKGLNVPLFSLFTQEDHDISLIRADERAEVGEGGVRYARLSPTTGTMEMLEGTLEPHARSASEPWSHSAHECLVVVTGQVTVTIDSRQFILGPGDSCYFDSRHPHVYENTGDRPARYIMSVTPPSY